MKLEQDTLRGYTACAEEIILSYLFTYTKNVLNSQGGDQTMGREVSESCLDILLIEIVSLYSNGFYAHKPELVAQAVEAIGYQVGNQLCERYTLDRPQFSDHLEAIKFICTDFWTKIFKKQIDTLRTDHKGTFVLRDYRFRWLSRASNPDSNATIPSTLPANYAQSRKMHLYFPCGIIRGALSKLAIPCAVTADISALPSCSFTIIIRRD